MRDSRKRSVAPPLRKKCKHFFRFAALRAATKTFYACASCTCACVTAHSASYHNFRGKTSAGGNPVPQGCTCGVLPQASRRRPSAIRGNCARMRNSAVTTHGCVLTATRTAPQSVRRLRGRCATQSRAAGGSGLPPAQYFPRARRRKTASRHILNNRLFCKIKPL